MNREMSAYTGKNNNKNLQMISSYLAGRYIHLDTLNSKIHPLFQILDTETRWWKSEKLKSEKQEQEEQPETTSIE